MTPPAGVSETDDPPGHTRVHRGAMHIRRPARLFAALVGPRRVERKEAGRIESQAHRNLTAA